MPEKKQRPKVADIDSMLDTMNELINRTRASYSSIEIAQQDTFLNDAIRQYAEWRTQFGSST